MKRRLSVIERFNAKVERSATGCWLWTGSKRSSYGLFRAGGRIQSAHRFAFETAHGPIPAGMFIRHRCGVRACVNPSHLFLVSHEAAERFNAMVERSSTGCWLWTGAKTRSGYGAFGVGGRSGGMRRAHRFAYEVARGSIPDGLLVLHKCDVRACVNPTHLFLGTQADNAADMVAKSRHPHGERHYRAKITESDVLAIRASSDTQEAIAARYGLARTTISQIQLRNLWRHVA